MIILAVIAYIILILMFPLIGGVFSLVCACYLKNKKAFVCLVVAVFTLGLFISFYIPAMQNDLYRYFQTMHNTSIIPTVSGFLQYSKIDPILQYQNNPLFNLFEYGISRTCYFYLLPYLTIVVCYFCILYPIFDLKEKSLISGTWALVLSVAMLSIYYLFYITTLVRWSLACALLILLSYLYFVKFHSQIKYIWMLFIPILIHLGVILAVGVSVYVALVKKMDKKHLFLPLPFFIFLLTGALMTKVSNASNNIIFKMVSMFQGYQDFARPEGLSNWISYIIDTGSILLIAIFALILMKRLGNKTSKLEFNFRELFLLYVFLISSMQIWQRYELIIGPFALIVCGMNYKNLKNINQHILKIIIVILIILRLYFVGYMKFKGMTFTVPFSGLCLSNLFFYINHLFTVCY